MSETDLDPLVERDQDEAAVRERQLLESMNEDARRERLAALLKNEDVRDLLWRVIEKCGIHDDPMSANFGLVAYGLGKSAIGKWLMVEINDADPQAWVQMQLRAALVKAELARVEATKRQRKGRSPSTSL